MRNLVAVLIAALLPLAVSAQIRKCVDLAGKTVYSDIVCLDTTARETLIDGRANGAPPVPLAGWAGVATPPGRSVFDQQLRNRIAEHLARKDFARAMDLAVTEEQFAMITAAQRQHDSDRATRRQGAPAKSRHQITPTGELIDKMNGAKWKIAKDMADTLAKPYKK